VKLLNTRKLVFWFVQPPSQLSIEAPAVRAARVQAWTYPAPITSPSIIGRPEKYIRFGKQTLNRRIRLFCWNEIWGFEPGRLTRSFGPPCGPVWTRQLLQGLAWKVLIRYPEQPLAVSFVRAYEIAANKTMKSTQKQTVRHGNLHKLPKLSIPPEVLILREVELLEMSERFSRRCRQEEFYPQHRRDWVN